MLKSELKKLENLPPEDVARDFRKRINAFDIFKKKLSKSHQEIIYTLVYNLLEENYKTDSGFFLQKLLEEHGISYYELAEYIYTYLYYTSEYHSENLSIENIKSYLQKMTKSKNFTKNILSDLICKYFSVDEDLIKYGIGNSYEMNFEKAYETLKENIDNIENIIEEVLNPTYIPDGEKPTKKEYLYYRNFISKSAIFFTELLQLYSKKDIDFLEKEKICIWDFDYLRIMINKLSLKEQNAVFDLIVQLQNL